VPKLLSYLEGEAFKSATACKTFKAEYLMPTIISPYQSERSCHYLKKKGVRTKTVSEKHSDNTDILELVQWPMFYSQLGQEPLGAVTRDFQGFVTAPRRSQEQERPIKSARFRIIGTDASTPIWRIGMLRDKRTDALGGATHSLTSMFCAVEWQRIERIGRHSNPNTRHEGGRG